MHLIPTWFWPACFANCDNEVTRIKFGITGCHVVADANQSAHISHSWILIKIGFVNKHSFPYHNIFLSMGGGPGLINMFMVKTLYNNPSHTDTSSPCQHSWLATDARWPTWNWTPSFSCYSHIPCRRPVFCQSSWSTSMGTALCLGAWPFPDIATWPDDIDVSATTLSVFLNVC